MTTAPVAHETAVPPAVMAGRLITGYATAQLVMVAAALRLGDHLATTALTAAELAELTGTRSEALARVLRGLSLIGLVSPDPPDRFRLTPLGACVSGSGPQSMRDLVMCGDESYRAWGDLLPCLFTGETPFVRAHGMTRYEYLERHPDRADLFNEAMAGMARGLSALMLQSVDFQDIDLVADLGGGNGALLAEVLVRDPRRRGLLFDTRTGLGGARRHLESRGVLDRCQIVEGDFFQSVPGGADAYVLSHVLHNWDDASALRIVENCGRAAARGAWLIVVEAIASGDVTSSPAAYPAVMTDLQMLVMTGGRHRTAEEHEDLLHAGGFELLRISRDTVPDCVILGRRS